MIAAAVSRPSLPELDSAGDRFEQLLAGAVERDDGAWRVLYDRFAGVVLGYLRARGAREADDILGEVFLQAVRDVDGFRGGEGAFRAWLLGIARHRLLDDVRRTSRRPLVLVPPEDIVERGPRGDAEADALELIGTSEVTRALACLAPAQREILLLRILGDLTVEQVATVVGKRPTAVKALQRRALARLRRELTRQGVSLSRSPALEEVR